MPPSPTAPKKKRKVSNAKLLREKKFIELVTRGIPIREAIKQVCDVGKKMKGEITTERINKSAAEMGRRFIQNMTEKNKRRLAELSEPAVEKIKDKMEATIPIYHAGIPVGVMEDHKTQLSAAKTILEFAGMKPAEKKEIVQNSLFHAVVEIVDGEEEELEHPIIEAQPI